MGSRYPPGFYDEHILNTIEGAFRDIWDDLVTRNPSHSDRDGLRAAVVHRLLHLVEEGISDPESLRTLTLSQFTNQPRT